MSTWSCRCSCSGSVEATYHFPPDLIQLLNDTIPRLCRSKRDVFSFFRGAGAGNSILSDLEEQFTRDPESIKKFAVVRTVLLRLNEQGDRTLRERREVLKRIVEFEDFSTCWPNDRLEAQGLVSRIRSVIEVKDAFTRMRQEREAEVQKRQAAEHEKSEKRRLQREELAAIQQDLNRLFAMNDPHERGRHLEKVLNRLFAATGIIVREAFTMVQEPGQGIVEQIDGVIELDGEIYLVEMKWLKQPVSVDDVSRHLVRVFNRSATRGIFISYTDYTAAAILACKDSLHNAVIVLCTLQEFVFLLERETGLVEFLKSKVRGSIIDKQPFTKLDFVHSSGITKGI
jgi:restriction system protein